MSKPAIGYWTRLFGRPLSFEQETHKAVEISANWSNDTDPEQWGARIEQLPGHMTFAWGSDSTWLYLRRPEGLWKLRINEQAKGKKIVLWQRSPKGAALGQMFIRPHKIGQGGYNWGHLSLASCADIDSEFAPSQTCPIECDEEWPGVYEAKLEDEQFLIADAGECTNAVDATFSIHATDPEWIRVEDRATRRKFALKLSRHFRKDALDGRLRLRLSGDWLEPMDVQVEVI